MSTPPPPPAHATPAPLSLRPLLLLFIGPLLQNTIVMTWINLMNFQATGAGYKSNLLCYVGICMAFGYTVSSFLVGRWITVAKASWVISIAVILTALLGIPIVAIPPFWPYLLLGLGFGFINGHYFCPFQVGMSSIKPFRTLAWTIAFYNVSWGTGVAVGPFLAGWLKGAPILTFVILAASLATLHTILVILAQTAPKPVDAASGPTALISSTPRLRKLGYLCSLVGQFVLTSLSMSLWPPLAHDQNLSDLQTGLGLAFLGLQIPIGAIVFATLRRHMARPWMLLGLLLLVAASFQLLPITTVWPWHLAVMSAIGFGCSGLFFHAVYYPNADPDNPRRSVGIMETCVGVAGFSGPLVMGNLVGTDSTAWWPYLIGSTLVLGVFALALRVWFLGEPPAPIAVQNENKPQINADTR